MSKQNDGAHSLTWRETVKGEYWKAGPFRIEKIRDFVALKFTERNDVVKIGWYPTLEAAKAACELEADRE